ncbi:UDP-N-acetylmuramate dehydrogenase [Candidatus Uhrbacteria bacterium]|nr:UDP-N-acetylmuramate dehydrogenase [Candidatus Uhrbacteria bacterium]
MLIATMTIKEHINLAEYTTFRVGGPARFFVIVATEQELVEALRFADAKSLSVFILGGGSNILVSDNGFDGLVIKNEIRGMSIKEADEGVLCTAAAGEDWDTFVAGSVAQGLSGLELLSGIPGTVGAAPVQNIGAYGSSVSHAITEVRAYDRQTGSFLSLAPAECHFSYRSSVFKKEQGRYGIVAVTFNLSRLQPSLPSYPDLVMLFAQSASPSVAEIRSAVLSTRAKKGMVILPGYESFRSAGSFFKNPIMTALDFTALQERTKAQKTEWRCRTPWYWNMPDGTIKVSAACLIQQAGFSRGFRDGRAGLSDKHALAIVNYGGATGEEIKEFSKKIQHNVKQNFGVILEPEVEFVGL